MASLIPGYEYDIFISYRQKDNKGDKWVSKFVEALKTELEATFKEDVSVYFDENPHDRLQETHNVDKSLEGKLKCLIFIPVLSQTYCDPNSYAWKYEFLAFNKLAKEDSFGRDVRLRSGNVASRILPIRIHDLEPEDVKLFEKETGSVLRALDFIFKTASGVSRPLLFNEDHPNDNLNKTYYRDQISKVAHTIKEIVLGMKAEPVLEVKETAAVSKEPSVEVRKEERAEVQEKPAKTSERKILFGIGIIAVSIVAAILAYPKIFKRDTLEKLRSSGERISVAVMPFQNMTNDTIWNVWQKGIQENLIIQLSNSDELKIRPSGSINALISSEGFINYASFTSADASRISQKINANIFIYGNIQKAGSFVRINTQLVDSKTEDVYKAFHKDGLFKEETLLKIVDSLSLEIKNFLILSQLKNKESLEFKKLITTASPEAYRNFISGMDAFGRANYPTARDYFLEAIKNDSNFIFAVMMLSRNDLSISLFEEGKEYCLKAYEKREHLPMYMRLSVDDLYAWYTIGPQGRIKYLNQLLDLDDQDPSNYYNLANAYRSIYQWDKAITFFEQYLNIYKKWRLKPPMVFGYYYLGIAYHQTGQYRKEKELYKKAEQDFPVVSGIQVRRAILSFSMGDSATATKYIQRYISIQRDNSQSEADIIAGLAGIFTEAGILDRAEEYYQQALSLEPTNMNRMNTLAYFLIDKGRNVSYGMALAEKVLNLQPDNYNFMHTKGWGLYKQGMYQEALDILQNSWNLRMKNAIYNHEAFLHLEAAKKAVAGLKSN